MFKTPWVSKEAAWGAYREACETVIVLDRLYQKALADKEKALEIAQRMEKGGE